MPDRDYVFAVGGIAPDNAELIDLGPDHPSQAGLLTARARVRDGVVDAIDPQPGALHRGAELLFATRDYRQILSLANRHDWQAPFFGEWVIARAVEDALGIDVPRAARWLRRIMAERTRIMSHLAYVSFVGRALGDTSLSTSSLREQFHASTAAWTGNRLHPMITRLGGIASAPPADWLDADGALWAQAATLAARIGDAATRLGVGVAPADPAVVHSYGLSGPIARASGVDSNVRHLWDLPDEVRAPDTLAPTNSDAASRFAWLAAEVITSAKTLRLLAASLPQGPLSTHLPKIVKLPEGDVSATVDAPLGLASVVITSRGEKTPWRLRLRTPSLANVSAWEAAIPGTPLRDLPIAVASLPWVAGDLDK